MSMDIQFLGRVDYAPTYAAMKAFAAQRTSDVREQLWICEHPPVFTLGLAGKPGVLSSALHRDDFAQRGMAASAQTQLDFDVNGADILVLDDVLYTGRTVRAVLNELFDYGRPARVRLAVLVDRGGRQLPIAADFAAARVALPASQILALARGADGSFQFAVKEA